MPNHSKAGWEPCGVCNDANGPIIDKSHSTPSRYAGDQLVLGMTEQELDAWEQGKRDVCGRCRNRIRMRMHRSALREVGLPVKKKPARKWGGA